MCTYTLTVFGRHTITVMDGASGAQIGAMASYSALNELKPSSPSNMNDTITGTGWTCAGIDCRAGELVSFTVTHKDIAGHDITHEDRPVHLVAVFTDAVTGADINSDIQASVAHTSNTSPEYTVSYDSEVRRSVRIELYLNEATEDNFIRATVSTSGRAPRRRPRRLPPARA